MDPDRARELLAAERHRIERELAGLGRRNGEPEDEDIEEGDQATDLYQDELDDSRGRDLRDQLEAVERAEARLEPLVRDRLSAPDREPVGAGLEARPTAELTVEEERVRNG